MSALDQAIAKLDSILASVQRPTKPGINASPAAAASQSAATQPSASSDTSGHAAAAAAAAAPLTGRAQPGARDCLVNKAMIKVARITSAVPQPNSAKLLKLQADLGGGDQRQIMAGLAQFIAAEQLVGRLVCVVANLKPAKLAGEPSEAMVLAAEAATADGGVIVRTLIPPEASCEGDLVHLDGCSPPEPFPKTIKSDDWRKIVPGLVAVGGKATFEGTPLVTSQGLVILPEDIPDGSEIH